MVEVRLVLRSGCLANPRAFDGNTFDEGQQIMVSPLKGEMVVRVLIGPGGNALEFVDIQLSLKRRILGLTEISEKPREQTRSDNTN